MFQFLQNEFEKYIFFSYLNFEREFWISRIGMIGSGEGL
jgi:hypothetical protein